MRTLLAVFVGGALGTAVRLLLDATLVHRDDQFPLSTLLINVIGSLVLAIFVARLWPVVPEWMRAALGPGLLGGFTTFSAVMLSMVSLAASNHILLAVGYLVGTLLLGFGAAALGLWLGRTPNAEATIGVDE